MCSGGTGPAVAKFAYSHKVKMAYFDEQRAVSKLRKVPFELLE